MKNFRGHQRKKNPTVLVYFTDIFLPVVWGFACQLPSCSVTIQATSPQMSSTPAAAAAAGKECTCVKGQYDEYTITSFPETTKDQLYKIVNKVSPNVKGAVLVELARHLDGCDDVHLFLRSAPHHFHPVPHGATENGRIFWNWHGPGKSKVPPSRLPFILLTCVSVCCLVG